MNNLQEVELRAFISQKQREDIEKILKDDFIKKSYIKDVYFCKNTVKDFKEVEMDEVGSFSLRIRVSKVDEVETISINMKVITTYGDHHAWDEHEIKVDNAGEAWNILRSLGYKDFFTLEKNRFSYKIKNMTINLEDILGEDSAIEVEIMEEKDKSEQAKNIIRKFLNQNDITDSQIVKKSITNILMHKRARF